MSDSSALARFLDWFFRKRSIGFGLEALGHFTIGHPRIVTVLVLAFTVLCFSAVPRASVDGNLMRVFADSGPEYEAYTHLSDTFGTFENDIYLLVNTPRLTDPFVLEDLRFLALELELNEYTAGTLSPFSLRKPAGDHESLPAVPEGMTTTEEVAAALSDLQRNDPMMRNLITPGLDGMVMIVFPAVDGHDDAQTAAMISSLRELVASYTDADIGIELTGPPIWTTEMLDAAVSDQIEFTAYGFSLGLLIAFFTLRSFWGAVLAASTPFIAVAWLMGAVTLLFGSFTFLTIIVTTLVLVISFAESLFFIYNWLAYWRDGMDPSKAVDATVKLIGPATALTNLVTFISFASLSLTPGQGIQEFSFAGMISSVIVFVGVMTFLPLLLKLAVRLGLRLPKAPGLVLRLPIPVAWFVAKRFGRPLTIFAILATLLLLIPYFLIQPHFSFEDYMPRDSVALEAAERIDEGVGGVAPLYIRLPLKEPVEDVSDGDFERIATVHRILEEQLGPGKVISAASFSHYAEAGFSRDQIFNAVGPFMKRRFVTDDGTQALITGFMPTIIASEELRELIDNTEAGLAEAGIEGTEIGGFRVMTTFATDEIVRSLQSDLTLSVLFNLGLIGFAFKSFRVALTASIPNLFPILGTEAFLWANGAGLQLTTVMALTIAFGIAVDDTVHFLSHYLHGRRVEGRDHESAVHHTMERIGGAIVATTIILCAGMAIVPFSDLPQVSLFGTLFVVTLALALLGDLFILPAMLVAGGRFFHRIGGVKE